ncbi:MAG: tail fiber protein [Pseudomonadota bacterium]
MAEPFIAEIKMFGGNFAPRNYALCDGQLLAISQNSALFSLIGTIYGGDGRSTMALPDMRGRVSMHAGTGPGLSPRPLGQKGGEETHTLNITEMPAHNHAVSAVLKGSAATATLNDPTNAYLGGAVSTYTDQTGRGLVDMAAGSVTATETDTGGSRSHNNMQPYLCVNYIIALFGTYPSRS